MIRSTTASKLALLGACAVTFASATAYGAPPSPAERTLAEALFREGRELTQQGRHAEACEKFAESQRLDPGGGTLLNLGLCHQKLGKLATAWTELREALAQARAEGRADRVEIAERQVAEIEPKLPRLEIVIAADALPEGFVVELDGVALNRAAWGARIPADPGKHVVRARAPERTPFAAEFDLVPGKIVRLEIPELARATRVAPSSTPAPVARETAGSGRKTLGYVVGGLGITALGIGSYFGVEAIDKSNQSRRLCPTDTTCTAEGVRLNESADESAWIANGGIGVGLVGIVLGAYLVLSAETPERTSQKLRLDVKSARDGGELRLRGAF